MAIPATITELPSSAVFDIKGSAGDVQALLPEFVLPARPNSASNHGGGELCWLGSEHWLLRMPIGSEDRLEARFRKTAANPDLLVQTVSDSWSFLAITGEGARDVLSTATSVDLAAAGEDAALFTEVFGQKGLLVGRRNEFELAVEDCLRDYMLLRLGAVSG